MSDKAVIGERIVPERFKVAEKQYLLYLRHLFAYNYVMKELPEKGTVLEVGCGAGYGTHQFSKKVEKVVGLDVNNDAVTHAAAEYGLQNCSFQAYDGSHIPFEDNCFAAAVSFQVIEHVQDDRNFISQISRVLQPGGLFFLTTPNRTLRLNPGEKPWNRYHVREYGQQELKELLEGFFSEVNIVGIRGSEEVQKIQTKNLKSDSVLVSFLRREVPEWLKLLLLRMRQTLIRGKGESDFLEKYGLQDFHIIKENVEQCLDLLAVCRK